VGYEAQANWFAQAYLKSYLRHQERSPW
jgi:hypothetical protein